ncbi:MAG: hypothetical protein KDJ52_01305 [Anaerolineae bacterium]|nr:hypothetical protein [Anaerolineae bacterium]
MSLAVHRADAEPARRATYLRVWSSLKNEQRRRVGLPTLAALPEADESEVVDFLSEASAA